MNIKQGTIKRESNLELLRIISIIMIIMNHYALYSGFEFGANITINKIIIDIFSAFGKLGVALFIIISGYFYEKSKFKIKKVINLLLKVWIYAIIGLIIGIVINSDKLTASNILKSVMPNLFGLYWFSSCYILIYIFSPFLKNIIEKFSKEDLTKCIMIMIFIWSIIGIIPKTKTFFNELIYLMMIYIIGGYIYKYEVNFIKNSKRRKIYIMTTIFIIIMIMI